MPKLTRVSLPLRQVLYEPGGPMDAVFFPETGMVSLVAQLADGMQSEVGVIGREGMVGAAVLAGQTTSFVESMVQLPCDAYCMGAAEARREFDSSPDFRRLAFAYSEALQAQVMQTAACNARHGLEERLARWLLMAHDRAESDTMVLTQEFMAMMLGVHRPSITISAGILQRAGLIRYGGGHVTIPNRASLEVASCECYDAVRRRFDAVLGPEPSR